MLTENQMRRYRDARQRGIDARNSLVIAKARAIEKLPFVHNDRGTDIATATLEKDGFRVVVKVKYDICADLSHLGKFTNNPDGAVRRRFVGRNEYKYVRPTISYSEHYRSLLSMKYGRAEADRIARAAVKDDIERLEKHENGRVAMCGVVVEVYRHSVELGGASLWGIDVDDPDDEYVHEAAWECIDEALYTARENLKKLCTGSIQ